MWLYYRCGLRSTVRSCVLWAMSLCDYGRPLAIMLCCLHVWGGWGKVFWKTGHPFSGIERGGMLVFVNQVRSASAWEEFESLKIVDFCKLGEYNKFL